VVRLSDAATGAGMCSSGSTPSSGSDYCRNGTQPSQACKAGLGRA